MIYKATKADAKAVAELAIQMWEENEIDELTGGFEEIIASPEGVVFLAEEEGQPIAFAQCQLRHDYVEGTDSSPVGYLEGIFVKEEYRKQGYARRLVAACEEWAKEQGCSEFASDCELTNTTSLEFHKRMGFLEANRIICFTKQVPKL